MSTASEPLLAKFLRWCVYVTAFMPLIIFSQYISPFHFGKVVVFRSLVELMAVAYLLLIWQSPSYLPRPNKVFWAFFSFTGAYTLAGIFGSLPFWSFWGTLERMGGSWTLWHFFLFFTILISVLRTHEHWEKFLSLTILTGTLSAVYGFGQKLPACPTDNPNCFSSFFIGSGNRERIFGTIGNAALFAGYEIVNFFLALTLLLRPSQAVGKKRFLQVAVACSALAIVMTVVRGSLLGLGVGLFIFTGWYYVAFRSKPAKKLFLAMVSVGAIFFLVLATPAKEASFISQSRFLKRITDTSFDAFTAKTRFWAWQAGLKGWSESPKKMIIGWGPESFNVPFSKYFNPQFFRGLGSETFFDRAHNMFVEILVTTGLLGLGTYLWIFVAALKSLWAVGKKNPRDQIYAIGLSSLLIAYAIHNSFIFDTSANLLVFFSTLGFIVFLNARHLDGAKAEPNRMNKVGTAWYATGVATTILALILIWNTNITQARANYATTRGIIAGWGGDFAGAVVNFKQATSFNVAGRYEYRNRATQYLLEDVSGKKLTPESIEALKWVAREEKKNIAENPPDYLPNLYLSRIYIVLGRDNPISPYNDLALKYSLRALEISPTFIRTFYEVAQAYLNKKDYAKGIEYFKQAAALNPEVGLTYWYWGVTEMQHGNIKTGLGIIQEAFNKGYGPAENEYLMLATEYLKLGDYNNIVATYQKLIELAPQNAQYRAALAVAYARLGKNKEAIASARKAAELDPTFLEEAKRFVQQLGGVW